MPLKWEFPVLIYPEDHTNNISYFYDSRSEQHHSFFPYGKDDVKQYLEQEEKNSMWLIGIQRRRTSLKWSF